MNALRGTALALAGVAGLAAGTAQAEIILGVTQEQTLVTFDSAAPGVILSGIAIQGMQPNETVRGIDLRPATGEVFVLGSFSRLYTVNTTTGVATQIGSPFALPLNGSAFGFDFNPTVDRIRVVSNADQNLRLNPNNGSVVDGSMAGGIQPDGTLAYAANDSGFGIDPDVVHAAYTNNVFGATSTTLYVLDTGRDVLAIQNANAGTLTTVGLVGADLTDVGGFDISGNTGLAYAAVRDVTLARTTFWGINLATGQGSMIGEVGGGSILTAMTVIPAPSAAALLGLAGLAAARRRR